MAQPDPKPEERAPSSIEAEMEVTRGRLADTIDQLVHRTSPKTIAQREVATLRSYFVDAAGNPRTDNIAKVAGGVVGFLALVLLMRRVTR